MSLADHLGPTEYGKILKFNIPAYTVIVYDDIKFPIIKDTLFSIRIDGKTFCSNCKIQYCGAMSGCDYVYFDDIEFSVNQKITSEYQFYQIIDNFLKRPKTADLFDN